ncbi:MAG: methionyl-tRNA formyltransferase [Candidatus Omnitrophota bacterium]|nr:MAG: methionyl-tRNA formyltransferase [Candidatus Omnitrophota bacterium]
MKEARFVYFGSSHFSCTVLKTLFEEGLIPTLVVSQPDRPRGRGLKVLPTEVSSFSSENGISLIKPASLKDEKIYEKIKSIEPQFFAVADYGKILPAKILKIPSVFPLGIHPALLPRYRGAAPIDRTLMAGEKETGVTIFKINEEVDAGEIIIQESLPIIESDDVFTLMQKLAKKGALLLIEVIKKIERNDYTLSPQDETKVSLAPKLRKEDGKIIWEKDAVTIRNLIRATLGWPSAYTYYKERLVKILEAEVINEDSGQSPSTIIKTDKEGIYVATTKGVLKIKKLRPEGKAQMDANSFVCGYRVEVGEKFF